MSPSTHYRTCNLCEAMCGIEITLENDQIVSIKGDRKDPFSQGHICPKAVALKDLYEDPDRLKTPLKRTAQGFKPIGWKQALDETAANIRKIQRQHGRHAMSLYLGNPNVHNHNAMLFIPLLAKALRTRNKFSATSVDQLPHHAAAYQLFGHMLMLPVPDLDRTQHLLMLGANPLVSNGSLMSAGDVTSRLKNIGKRGGKLVVVDPRRTETAQLAHEHHFIRPGSDAFLLMAMVHLVFLEGWQKLGRLEPHVNGLEAVKQAVESFSPEAVAGVTGISAETIGHLTREFCAAPSAVCYLRMGASTQQHGALANWLAIVLNLITGNLDSPGGAMFTLPAVDLVQLSNLLNNAGHYNAYQSRVQQYPEFAGELPVSALATEIITPGAGQIKGLMTMAGNPVLSTPNGAKLDAALSGLEFMVSVDIYLNETTRHAHIILPPTMSLEHDHYDLVFNLLAVRNVAKYSPALFAPSVDSRHDWQILSELISRLGSKQTKHQMVKKALVKLLNNTGVEWMLDLGLRFGPHGMLAKQSRHNLSLSRLKSFPHGLDLGPLTAVLPERLFTTSGKIELAPEVYLKGVERMQGQLNETVQASERFPFLLIGRRHLRSNNSWMHNTPRLIKGKPRCTCLIHPQDAQALALSEGDTVRVSSRVGSVEIPVNLSQEIMPGVISIPHGWGHQYEEARLSVAQEHAGVNINLLTDDEAVDPLLGTAILNGVPVKVERIEATVA